MGQEKPQNCHLSTFNKGAAAAGDKTVEISVKFSSATVFVQ